MVGILEKTLCCPHDMGVLAFTGGAFHSKSCGRFYQREDAIVHFVMNDQERPVHPKKLGDGLMKEIEGGLTISHARKQSAAKERLYSNNAVVRKAVDFVL